MSRVGWRMDNEKAWQDLIRLPKAAVFVRNLQWPVGQNMTGHNIEPELTRLLQAALAGDRHAESRFCRAVYNELHHAANRLVRHAGSVQATSLVHDVFLKLFRRDGLKKAPNRRYFYSVAVDQMRKLLIDHHRKRKRLKSGGDRLRLPSNDIMDHVLQEFEEQNGCDVEAPKSKNCWPLTKRPIATSWGNPPSRKSRQG